MQPKIGLVRDLLLGGDTCLVIPPYQRPYEWTKDRWQSLIRDIVEGITSQRESHFIGVAITTESKPECTKAGSPLLHKHIDIIDGQQRLLTLRIWLQAILDHSRDEGSDLNVQFTNVYCQETDLENWDMVMNKRWVSKYKNFKPEESGLLHAYTYFRWILWLGQDAMTEQEPDETPKLARNQEVMNNYDEIDQYWTECLLKRNTGQDSSSSSLRLARSPGYDPVDLLRATVDRLSLLVLEVNNQDEDPADIFNALNGQRTEMMQFDHLRNFIFANIKEADLRADLYEHSWKNVERQVSKLDIGVKGSSAFDTFLYDLLISLGERRYQSVSKDKTARQFAKYYNSNRNSLAAKGIAEKVVLTNLVSWASIKKNGVPIEIGRETKELPDRVKTSLVTMEWMSSGPVVPLLLNLVNRYYYQNFSKEDLQKGINLVENYLGRHIISGDPLSPLRASIMNICGRLGATYTLDELEALLQETKHKDAELKKRILPSGSNKTDPYNPTGNIYELRTSRQLLAIFQGIERHLVGEHCSNLLRSAQDDVLTIDHIFPQSSDKWKADVRKWEESTTSLKNRLHTFGNLAVIPKSINSDMSNERFLEKKNILAESRFVKLSINENWQAERIGKWTPELIDARADFLLTNFLEYYPY
jgi:uncharacterized protein with ParB-like and HNH nuclease domain